MARTIVATMAGRGREPPLTALSSSMVSFIAASVVAHDLLHLPRQDACIGSWTRVDEIVGASLPSLQEKILGFDGEYQLPPPTLASALSERTSFARTWSSTSSFTMSLLFFQRGLSVADVATSGAGHLVAV
jgi:hypothetical protein